MLVDGVVATFLGLWFVGWVFVICVGIWPCEFWWRRVLWILGWFVLVVLLWFGAGFGVVAPVLGLGVVGFSAFIGCCGGYVCCWMDLIGF